MTGSITISDIVGALALPASCRVDKRVPKKMLAEHGGATATDRRLLTDGIEEVCWVAAIKPATAAIPIWRDDVREYLELAVVTVAVRVRHAQPAQLQRLAELIHRAVPYPVLLIVSARDAVLMSLSHKRSSLNEVSRVVLEGEMMNVQLSDELSAPEGLLTALALGCQPQQDLMALYQGWMDTVLAAHVARVTGKFVLAATPDQAASRRAALREYRLHAEEADRLRALAVKETQIAKRVELNLALQRVHAAQRAAKNAL